MLTITDRAASALEGSLTPEDRQTGSIFKLNMLEDQSVELRKAVPESADQTLEHEGAPVLAVPPEAAGVLDSLTVDIVPTPDGESMTLVIKSGTDL